MRKKALEVGDRKLAVKYLVQMRRISGYDPMDANFRRLLYIRYADDFIILAISTYEECCIIRDKIYEFLLDKCGLTLNINKTHITSSKKHFKFLGADITNNPTKDYVVFDKGINTWKKAHIRTLIKAPIKDLVNKLKKVGLVKQNKLGFVFPKGRTNLFTASHYDIIKWYNSKVNGILNYYSFASNYPKLSLIIWYLRASCALTLANKYKLKTMGKAFAKFGGKLKDLETGVEFNLPSDFKVKNLWHTHNPTSYNYEDLDKIINSSWATKLTDTIFGKVCTICESTEEIEMHHVRKIANIRSFMIHNGYKTSQLISAMNRKQVPLCKYHHQMLHKGKLSIWDFKKIVDYK